MSELSPSSLAWVLTRANVGLLTGAGAVPLKEADGQHKVLLHWIPSETLTDASGIPIEGLVAYYPFNGNAEDASGNGNHAEVHGATLTYDKAGNAESAYRFDGRSSFILAPVNINPDVIPNMTMVAWARSETDRPVKKLISHDAGAFGRSIGIDARGGGIGWSASCGTGRILGYEPVNLKGFSISSRIKVAR